MVTITNYRRFFNFLILNRNYSITSNTQDKQILLFRITNTGVLKVMKKNGEAVEIKATRKKDERLEGDFYKPSKKESSFFGEKSYPIEFRNKTGS